MRSVRAVVAFTVVVAGTSAVGISHAASAPAPPSAGAAVSGGVLPLAIDDIPVWAARTMPSIRTAGFITGTSGWLNEVDRPVLHAAPIRLRPARYTVTLACLGDGGLDYSLTDGNGARLMRGGIACGGGRVDIPVDVPRSGLGGDLTLRDGPVVYALTIRAEE